VWKIQSLFTHIIDFKRQATKSITNEEFRSLEGQTQAVSSEAVAPVLIEFFKK
jgi:hypothetical protein